MAGFVCHIAIGVAILLSPVRVGADRVSLFPAPQPSGKFAHALDLMARGQLRDADAVLREIVEKDPGQAYAALAQVQIAVTERRVGSAEKAIATILQQQPSLPEAHNMRGVVALLSKQPQEARSAFSRAIELRPGYVTPRVYLAALDRADGEFAKAATAYQQLIEMAPRLSAGYLGKAEAQIMMNKPAEAFATLDGWKRADPASPQPSQVIGTLHLARGSKQKAIEELKDSLTRHPKDAATLTSLGNVYAATGDSRSAAAQFEAALVADPSREEAILGLGDLQARSGAADRALAQYRRVLKVNPTNAVAANNVAWVLAEGGQNLDEALRLAKVAAASNPTYVDAQDTLGFVYYRRGEFAAAIATLQQAKTLAPDRGDIAAHLGLAYAKVGRRAEAVAELKRALNADTSPPVRDEVQRKLAELSASPTK